MNQKPKTTSSLAEQELDKAQAQFEAFDANIKELTQDRMNEAPKKEMEPQTKLSQDEISKSKDIYLKPERAISSREKFNEKYRTEYEAAKEYVYFIAENKEIIGEAIETWTKPFAGMSAEFWKVPTNKPLWGPRYLAEQIARKTYHRMVMQQTPTHTEGNGQFYGSMTVDSTIPRLEARPVSRNKSIFIGANAF